VQFSNDIPNRPVSFYDLTFEHLKGWLAVKGLKPIHAESLWKVLYARLETRPGSVPDLSPPLDRWLKEHRDSFIEGHGASVAERVDSSDGNTRKMLLKLVDGQIIETVLMGYPGRFTACLSSQAGCAMGCVFCATGQMGFARNLSPGEILAQIIECQRLLRAEGNALRNLVVMGMGEPFQNYDAVMQALRSATRSPGLCLGPAHISVSTVGVVPGIIRFADEGQPYSLGVSLHASSDEERSPLLPVNQRWPLAELIDACKYYVRRSGRRVFFGWTLIHGRNDSVESADRLVGLLGGVDAHVNLIRLNTTAGFDGVGAAKAAAEAFKARVQAGGVPCTLRQFRGIDVAAGCGQLRSNRNPRRPAERNTSGPAHFTESSSTSKMSASSGPMLEPEPFDPYARSEGM
jgi:23S rRNA (adenine2503-C2)-methyltransferase